MNEKHKREMDKTQAKKTNLEVLKNVSASGSLLTPGLDDGARAADDLGGTRGLALLDLPADKAAPFAQSLGVGGDHDGDVVLLAQGLDELVVGRLVHTLREDAQVGLAAIQGWK